MRAVLQRVSKASVTIHKGKQESINLGLLVLLGIEEADNQEDIEWLSKKIVQLRIFNNANDVMDLSIKDVCGDILLISQFTLHAKTKKGNRPSYIHAAKPKTAIPLYRSFINQLETELDKKIKTGEFGAKMEVELVNDGPVTILIDTKNRE